MTVSCLICSPLCSTILYRLKYCIVSLRKCQQDYRPLDISAPGGMLEFKGAVKHEAVASRLVAVHIPEGDSFISAGLRSRASACITPHRWQSRHRSNGGTI